MPRANLACLSALVRTLLEMSNLQAVPRDDCIELAPLADEIVTDLTPLAQKKQITLHQECEDIHIIGSDALIYRMLFNLVENAIKYNQPGGSVQITISRSNGKAILRVADTGCGIPDEYRTSIFEPFFRVDKSRSREMGGAGLGLALVREIAALHGGTVQDEPTQGAGTVFTVALPMQSGNKSHRQGERDDGSRGHREAKASRKREMHKFAKCNFSEL